MSVSVVVPIFNEWENVRRLHVALCDVLRTLDRPYEILFVDDGSTDGSNRELELLAADDARVKVIELRRNFGQTAALAAGIAAATEDVIITMDGDLQNDPADIPMLLDKLDEGYDLVHGWRRDRKDALLRRRLPSRAANWLIARVTGYAAHDLGCGLKAMRRDVARELPLHGEMHRFIPVLAHARGAKCAEVITRHHARQYGESKYGLSRTMRVLCDLITVKFVVGRVASPMRYFGLLSLLSLTVALAGGAAAVGMSLTGRAALLTNPLLAVGVLSMLFAMQCVGLGLIGESVVRGLRADHATESYAVRRTLNLDETSEPREQTLKLVRAA